MRFLVLISDAYGGRGGIAKFNRDLLSAVASHPATQEAVVLPRVIFDPPESPPTQVTFVPEAAGGKLRYMRSVVATVRQKRRYDVVICGHLYLLPIAAAVARWQRGSLVLITHGIEAWQPTQGRFATALTKWGARAVTLSVSVSDFTRQRVASWLPIPRDRTEVVPNCVDLFAYGARPKPAALLERYGVADRTVIMTLGRLAGIDRAKGFDEVMEVIPRLIRDIPDLSYMICGGGPDRARLEEKARQLGISDRVVFTGFVPEVEKADHYRMADAFVLPGRGEGFGIVYLEALACGIPVVASSADASQEAVLNGRLGDVVDPDNPQDIARGIRAALARPRIVPSGLEYFSAERFTVRWHGVIDMLHVEPLAQERRIENAPVLA